MDPLLWLGILAVLLIIEAATVGLVTVWFAGGALAAAIASGAGAGAVSYTHLDVYKRQDHYCLK